MCDKKKNSEMLEHVYRLVAEGSQDLASDILFAEIDQLCLDGKFLEVNDLMCQCDLNKLDTNLIVALLCSTFPARDKLPDRSKIVYLAEARLKVIALDRVKYLMSGLY